MELTNTKQTKSAKIKNVQQMAAQLKLSSVHERSKRRLHPYILPMTPITTIPTTTLARVEENVVEENVLVRLETLPPDENPAAVYLASLALGSRRSMKTALNLVAALLTSGRSDAFSLHWGALRFQHTAAIRSALAQRYAASSANHRLAALRGVLKAAWNLGQIPTEEYHRAVNLPPVRGES